MNPHEEKLWRMLEEGKITLEQWEALRANLPGAGEDVAEPASPPPPPPLPPRLAPRMAEPPAGKVPGPIRACSIMFFVIGVLTIFAGIYCGRLGIHDGGAGPASLGPFSLLFAGLTDIAMGYGLLLMRRWIYTVALVMSVYVTIASLATLNLLACCINAVFPVLLLSQWRLFYPKVRLEDLSARFVLFYRRNPPLRLFGAAPAPLPALVAITVISGVWTLCPLFGARVHETPLEGILAVLTVAALAYGLLCRSRIVAIIFAYLSVLGLLVALEQGDFIQMTLKAARIGLLFCCWRMFFPGGFQAGMMSRGSE